MKPYSLLFLSLLLVGCGRTKPKPSPGLAGGGGTVSWIEPDPCLGIQNGYMYWDNDAGKMKCKVLTEVRVNTESGDYMYAVGDGKSGSSAIFPGRLPQDVPAIKKTHEEEYGSDDWCNITSCVDPAGFGCTRTSMYCDPHAKHKVTVDTCSDNHRILLQSLDGKSWCHLPQTN